MLNEGLSRHSLKHLVMPVVSIDEYESKIDDRRVIVTGFYVRDYDPASDLSSFVEKSSIRPLDTEVSPAPTDDGWYMVFVEMSRNGEYPKRLMEMLDQVGNLTDTTKWSFKPYGSKTDELYDVDEKNLAEYINLDPEKVEIEDEPGDQESEEITVDDKPEAGNEDLAEAVGSFLRNSLVESIEIKGEYMRIKHAGGHRVFRIVDYRAGSPSIPMFGLNIGEASLSESIRLQNMVGPEYSVDSGDGVIILDDGTNHLILAVDR